MTLVASTPWPVIIVWVVAVLFARLAQQQKTRPPRRPLAPPGPADQARSEMGDTLQRAMEKLKQAEREARQGPAPMPARASARPLVRPSIRLVLEDHSALSQESEPEVVDYDDAAAGIAESRARDAEAFERGDATAPPRVQVSAAVSARPPVRPSAPLSRYADGSLRGAIIVTEILGRPKSER